MSSTRTVSVISAIKLRPGRPLWQRLPPHGRRGKTLGDIMVLIPGLRDSSPDRLARKVAALREVIERFGDLVVFADLNLQLNLLWISMHPAPGASLEISGHIREALPEARLVASQAESRRSMRRGWRFWRR